MRQWCSVLGVGSLFIITRTAPLPGKVLLTQLSCRRLCCVARHTHVLTLLEISLGVQNAGSCSTCPMRPIITTECMRPVVYAELRQQSHQPPLMKDVRSTKSERC